MPQPINPQEKPVKDSAGEDTNLKVASNFSRLSTEEQTAVKWHVGLQHEKAIRNGNSFAAANQDQFIANGLESMATNNASGVRQTVERFNDPSKKATAEMMAREPSIDRMLKEPSFNSRAPHLPAGEVPSCGINNCPVVPMPTPRGRP